MSNDMNDTVSMTPLLEAGLEMVESVSTYLDAVGVSSDISTASDCEPGG